MTYEQYYDIMRADAPDVDELLLRKNALTAANLDAALQAHRRRKQVGVVRLVPVQAASGFVNSLFGAIDTTGRMPVVRPKEEEQGEIGV